MERKQIEVMGVKRAREFQCDKPWLAISIATQDWELPELSEVNRVAIHQTCFADASFPLRDVPESSLFNAAKAKEILDFVQDHWDRVDVLLVHCQMGFSRSPAVAAAIEHIYYGSGADDHWFEKKSPNMFVYRTLLDTHYGQTLS